MRRSLALCAAAVFAVSVAACGGPADPNVTACDAWTSAVNANRAAVDTPDGMAAYSALRSTLYEQIDRSSGTVKLSMQRMLDALNEPGVYEVELRGAILAVVASCQAAGAHVVLT